MTKIMCLAHGKVVSYAMGVIYVSKSLYTLGLNRTECKKKV